LANHSALAFGSLRRVVAAVLVALVALPSAVAAGVEKEVEKASSAQVDYFAIVDGEPIALQDYHAALSAGMRKKFYHGNVPDEKLAAFRDEVGQSLIDRVLFLREASRRKLKPDPAVVAGQLDEYDKRYASKPGWQQHRDEVLAALRAGLSEENVLEQLRVQVQAVPPASELEARRFYQDHPDLFTTPERARLSTIVLKVAPSSPAEIWAAAEAEAQQLVAKLRKGTDFAQLARIHSGDETAASGGDMGYLHKGMLAEPAQRVVDKLEVGQISDPVMLLPGVAVFRLDERVAPKLNPFDAVSARAGDLVWREQSAAAWSAFVDKLRSSAKIERNLTAR